MTEYIKKEDAAEIAWRLLNVNFQKALTTFKSTPAADVCERKHGKWLVGKYDSFTVRCSECFETSGTFTNFCSNCGASMDGDQLTANENRSN